MGEFKDGALKSGGSGRKVTNPKQAIAIALSEAEGMNQGGMMYSDIMNRPMFQTPQQRQGMGIMAGVAPVRGYNEGGEAEEIAVTAESPEELDIKLFGEGGVLFDTDSPISSTLMAECISANRLSSLANPYETAPSCHQTNRLLQCSQCLLY